ncbi:hypothetical protein F5141DRAFT_1210692 [Pisolithus sp. B1]|nr:hypothetical protein F5141DRAFT_1210692 [Pisolithus sp. B1]
MSNNPSNTQPRPEHYDGRNRTLPYTLLLALPPPPPPPPPLPPAESLPYPYLCLYRLRRPCARETATCHLLKALDALVRNDLMIQSSALPPFLFTHLLSVIQSPITSSVV